MTDLSIVKVDGKEYVLIPKAEYDALVGAVPAGAVEAVPFAMKSIGADLRKARKSAGLTQTELAKKLKMSQPMVSSVEAGRTAPPKGYAEAVLKACGLPKKWKR
jgi:DNA-binding XRE family transcriptional regulator